MSNATFPRENPKPYTRGGDLVIELLAPDTRGGAGVR